MTDPQASSLTPQASSLKPQASPTRMVLFDAVGTLIHPDPPVAEAYFEAGCRHGSGLNAQQIEQRFRRAFANHCDAGPTSESRERCRWRDIVSQVFDDVTDSQEALFESLWQHFAQAEHWALFPDVRPAWEALAAAGVNVGIASNFDQRLENICRRLPPLDRADHLFYSSGLGYPKPRAEFFSAIQQQLELPAHAILMVGDSQENDVAPARAAGWSALRIDRQRPSVKDDTIQSLMEATQRC